MSVAQQTPYSPYIGNGVTTIFPYTFKILAEGDLKVYVDGALKTLNVDYTVSGVGASNGGNVTMITGAPLAAKRVMIVRARRQERLTDYQNQGDFDTPVVNPDFDNPVLLLQDLGGQIGRAIAAPEYEPDALMTLPARAARANTIVAFNANGDIEPAASIGVTVLSQSVIGGFLWPRSAFEIAAGVVPTNYFYSHGNVLRYGADSSGAASSQTAFDNAKLVAAAGAGMVYIPAGNYKVNWVITDAQGDYLWVKTDGFRTRLLPVSNASPVVDIVSTVGGNGITGLRFDHCLIDSQASGVGTHIGIGFRARATSPGFNWVMDIPEMYVRGFQDNFVFDCDINLGELFANSIGTLHSVDASRYSVYTRGIYANIRRIFSFHCGQYALFNQGSFLTLGNLDCDGVIVWGGTAARGGQIVIENIYGTGAAAAVDINNANHGFDQIILREVPAAKCPIGVSFGALANGQDVGSIVVTGVNFPTTPISMAAGSAGVVRGDMTIPGGAKISTSTAVISNWRFLGANIATAFIGDRYLDTNALIENSGRLRLLGGGTTFKRRGIAYSAAMTIDASLGSHFTITANNGVAFTINAPTNPQDGSEFEVTIYNASGGALGAVTWNAAFKLAAWVSPANGFNRSIRYRYDGSFWAEMSRTPADVPN